MYAHGWPAGVSEQGVCAARRQPRVAAAGQGQAAHNKNALHTLKGGGVDLIGGTAALATLCTCPAGSAKGGVLQQRTTPSASSTRTNWLRPLPPHPAAPTHLPPAPAPVQGLSALHARGAAGCTPGRGHAPSAGDGVGCPALRQQAVAGNRLWWCASGHNKAAHSTSTRERESKGGWRPLWSLREADRQTTAGGTSSKGPGCLGSNSPAPTYLEHALVPRALAAGNLVARQQLHGGLAQGGVVHGHRDVDGLVEGGGQARAT